MRNMYDKFAFVYDELMKDIPYDRYVELIDLATNGLQGKKVLDIGCGTGVLSLKIAKMGAQVTAVDPSPSMLEIAKKRASHTTFPIQFMEQRMEQLNIDELFDVAIISIDSLNYVTRKEDVKKTFTNIFRLLKKDGVLLFDVHSTFKMDVIFLESPFVYDDENIAYIWHTKEGNASHSIHSSLTFFVKKQGHIYERFDESHMQRTFPIHTYVDLLEKNGFKIERIFADWKDEAPECESERIFFQVRK